MKKEYSLQIGDRTAEEIKINIGSAYPFEGEGYMEVKGRDMVSGLPKVSKIKAAEIRTALFDPVNEIIECIKMTLEKTPPELAADIMERGIMLAGGGALLRGLDEIISLETKIAVNVAEMPLNGVIRGIGGILEGDERAKLRKVLETSKKFR